MWSYQHLSRIDFRVIPLILALMGISLLIISSHTSVALPGIEDPFLTPLTIQQLRFFFIGWIVFFFFAGFDYNKLREWTWILYIFMIVSLFGLFFTDAIQRVNRWYRIPFINIGFQPSESAKLIVVIALSWFLERRKQSLHTWGTVVYALLIVGIPFILILKQPDLGTALALFPITIVMFYFGGLHPLVVRVMVTAASIAFLCVACIFLGFVSHEDLRPYASHVLKSYQFKRLDPNTHHQKAALTAIAVGGITGTGWRKSEFTSKGWLPTPYTDSVFPAFGEEFGILGLFFMLALFYALLHCSFQVAAVAKDLFGRLLSAGITLYLTVHVLINMGMMSGLLPITGVPLILVSYGGTSILATMSALGILQNIYSRRFMF
jgi:rod shape determining protein RodA